LLCIPDSNPVSVAYYLNVPDAALVWRLVVLWTTTAQGRRWAAYVRLAPVWQYSNLGLYDDLAGLIGAQLRLLRVLDAADPTS